MKEKSRNFEESRSAYQVSIIIPAFNEERSIGSCLDAIATLRTADAEFEVLVIDNGSADRTVEIARNYAGCLNLRTVVEPGVHVSVLRNTGARLATGKYLAFVDADCIVSPHWLANLIGRFRQNERGIWGAHYQIPASSTWIARAWYGKTGASGPTSYVPGGTLAISRSHFLMLGGFDEDIQTNEDYEFCRRARDHGLITWADPSLATIHLGTPQTLTAFFQKQRWHGTHVFKVFWGALPKLRNVTTVVYTLYVLSTLAGVAAGLAAWAVYHSIIVLLWAASALTCGAAAAGCWRAFSERRIRTAPQLSILYLAFGIARVCSLTSMGRKEKTPRPRSSCTSLIS